MKNYFKNMETNKGQAMLISIVFFLFIALAIISGLVAPTVQEFKISNDLLRSKQSFVLSESGIEDAYHRLRQNLPLDSGDTILTIGDFAATTSIEDSGYNQKTITSQGDVSLRQRRNRLIINTGEGVSFSYGVQVGIGGLTMGNGSSVDGSVYSNGSVVCLSGTCSITGTAASANSPAESTDQENESGTPDYDLIFGDGNSTQDFAQSFQVSETGQISKVELYLKKTGSPGSLTVRIVDDNSGEPGSTTLTSGPLASSLVSTNYGWVEATFSSAYELQPGTTYWLVIDGGSNSSRYYFIGADSSSYGNGEGQIGRFTQSWSDTTPAGLDGFFRLYLGGVTGFIDLVEVGENGEGDAYAHTVNNSTIEGINYCQEGSGNNKACDTSLPDPTSVAMPISEQNILDWKAEGEDGGTYEGDFLIDNSVESLGPIKVTGDMTVRNSASLTMEGTIWVQGNLIVSNNADIWLSSDYQTSEGVIVVDGTVDINQNAEFHGSGTGSYLMILSTSTSTSAINIENNGGAVILYAAEGTVNMAPNSGAKALNGKYINLENNAEITYESGLANSNFVNGPSGGWGVSSWKEIE